MPTGVRPPNFKGNKNSGRKTKQEDDCGYKKDLDILQKEVGYDKALEYFITLLLEL